MVSRILIVTVLSLAACSATSSSTHVDEHAISGEVESPAGVIAFTFATSPNDPAAARVVVAVGDHHLSVAPGQMLVDGRDACLDAAALAPLRASGLFDAGMQVGRELDGAEFDYRYSLALLDGALASRPDHLPACSGPTVVFAQQHCTLMREARSAGDMSGCYSYCRQCNPCSSAPFGSCLIRDAYCDLYC